MTRTFRRDRLTWIAYLLLAWFAYLQAAPGLLIGHLRDELNLSYSTGGLHVAAFAAGSLVAGVISARLERALGRRTLLWSAAALMGAGAIGLTAGRIAELTLGSLLIMGVGGGLLLATIQAALADHHGERRAVALAEANLAASLAYLVLIGVLSLTAALHAGWRVALLASLAVPVLAWWRNRAQALVGLSLLGLGLGNLFPMGLSVTVALAPERAVLASGRAVAMTSFAVLLAPLTVGTLADATSLRAAFGVVPVALALAAAGLTLVGRARTPASAAA
jgi:MFS family permease